jgi:hypothetical protein
VGKLTEHARKVLGSAAGEDMACFHLVDLKNINNMNEAFEKQFCMSGCLAHKSPQKLDPLRKNVAVIL